MRKLTGKLAIAGLALGMMATAGATGARAETFITIGTGSETGVYFQVGQAICSLVNRGTSDHDIKCTAPSTGGSIDNINAIKAGDRGMGVAQSDWQYHAYNGTSKFEEQGAFKDLRAVFSVHGEPFNVVARDDANINSFEDLKGKRVNIGSPGSGQRATMEVVMNEYGWTNDDFALAAELDAKEQSSALCDNNLDAIIYTVGHPNGSISEAFATCPSHIVNVQSPEIDKLVDENPFYAYTTIPGGTYEGKDEDVTTFGVKATFVSSAEVPEETVYQVVKAVFDNIDRFRKLHPAFAALQEEEMISGGLSAPLHAGAEKYYRERGWIQ